MISRPSLSRESATSRHAKPVRTAAAKSPGRCLGAAAQLAAVHRTLAGGVPLQLRMGGTAPADAKRSTRAANRTGLPDRLKAGVEALSGLAMDDVRVHRNSAEPARLGALAYAQGSDIHLAPDQEGHLPHETWHVVQQKQGRVKATVQLKGGVAVNDDPVLEREADVIGSRLSSGAFPVGPSEAYAPHAGIHALPASMPIVQRQEISLEAARTALAQRAAAFFALPHEILTPWGNDPEASNCHGYTVHGVVDRWIDGEALLDGLGNAPAIVFARNGRIAHSGRPEAGGKMTHFLIGVGITRSTIGAGLAGYDARYTLPEDRNALDTDLEQAEAARAIANALPDKIRKMVSAIYRALNLGLNGAEALRDRVFDLDDDHDIAGKDEIIAAFDAFAEDHPQILESEEEESQGEEGEEGY